MSGRTNYWPKDQAWWGRGRIIKAGREHGPIAPAILDFIICEAKAQNPATVDEAWVKVGYEAIAFRATFGTSDDVQVRPVVATLVRVGLLDDFEEDGDSFTCRISGWREDVFLPLEAARKREARGRTRAGSGSSKPDVGEEEESETSGNVRERPAPSSKAKQSKDVSSNEDTHGARADALPPELPERLAPVVPMVAERLRRIADVKGAQPVTLAAVGRALAALPDRDHLGVADDVEHYWCHGQGQPKRMRDVVQTYRNRLKSEPVVRPPLSALDGGAGGPTPFAAYDEAPNRWKAS